MAKSSSLAFRASIAVALLVGFYFLAIAIAAVLAYIPYAEWNYAHRLHFKLAFSCVAAAVIILWSIVPRPDRFVPPGPELKPDVHPGMFKAIREVAERTKQDPPASVYIVPEMNAWVAQRGGLMGIGSSRVMGIGLPLLQVTTTSQFKAILAHEFGHYDGGDTSLGPWIYKTRQTIGRTLGNLGDGSWLQKPFMLYGNLFLRITHAISRQQEFNADRLSARIYGREAAIGGLKAVYGHSASFQRYWHNEVSPILNAGRKPPIAEGFQRFLAAPMTAEAFRATLEEELKGRETDPYDTHPSLVNRMEALNALPARPQPQNDQSALTFLRDVPALEAEMLSHLAGEENAKDMKPIHWDAVGSNIYLPHWEAQVKKHAVVMQAMTAGAIAEVAADLPAFSKKLVQRGEPAADDDERKWAAAGLLGAALLVTLHRQGWSMHVMPGEEVLMERPGTKTAILPFEAVRNLATGSMKKEDWHRQCVETGIADLALYQG
jgi:heat shock protein HtpX